MATCTASNYRYNKRIVVIGSSHVRRMPHDEFLPNTTTTLFIGIGGARVDTLNRAVDQIINFCPDFIFLQIGSNDLDNVQPNPVMLSRKIIELCKYLKSITGAVVRCGTIFVRGRPRHLSQDRYDFVRNEVNRLLLMSAFRWTHRAMNSEIIGNDGVHLNVRGNVKFWRSIRGCILQYIAGYIHR